VGCFVPIRTELHAAKPCTGARSQRFARAIMGTGQLVVTHVSAADAGEQDQLYGAKRYDSDGRSVSRSVGSGGLEDRLARMHPAAAVASIVLSGYAAICLVFIACGALITHQLGALTRWDNDVVRSFARNRTTTLNDWSSYATKVADTVGILVVLVAAALVLLVLRYRWQALFLVIALSLELLSFLTINAVVGRPRPSGSHLGSVPSTSSYPSGHTAAMIALYGGLAILLSARFRARVVAVVSWLIALCAASAIGLARVYRGMHHPSDVVFGALLGFAVLLVAIVAVRVGQAAAERRRSRAASPAPSLDRAGAR
jgi:membrane-associated phospholipid phosphatase